MEPELTSPALIVARESAPASICVDRPIRSIACLVTSDVLAIVLSLAISALLRLFIFKNPASSITGTMSAALVLVLCSLIATGLYPGVTVNPVLELRSSTLAITMAFLSLWAATYFLRDLSQSRFVYVLAYVLVMVTVPLFRSWTRTFFCTKPWWGSSVAILGLGNTGKNVLEILSKNPRIGLKPVAVLDDDPRQYSEADPRLVRGPLSRCLEIASSHKIPYGIVCMPSVSREALLDFLDQYGQCFGHILIIPNLMGMTSLGICAREVGGIVGLEVTQQLLRPSSQFMKRTLDLAITVALAPILIPLLFVAALLVKLEDAGPMFYANERIGHRGRRFKTWKLRSMVTNGDEILHKFLARDPEAKLVWDTTQKLKRDPRLTRVGRVIRKTSIDELPQFWNVLKGEMSVVGPRPVQEHQVEMYGPSFNLYRQVRPGITGLWQVSGRNNVSFAERVKFDKYVIQNWSVWLDIYILARTAAVVITGDGAY